MDFNAEQVAVLVAWREEMLALTRQLASLSALDPTPADGGVSVATPAAIEAVESWLESNGYAPAAVKRAMLSQANLTAYVFHSLFNLAEARGAQWNPGDRAVAWAALMTLDAGRVEEKHREALDHVTE